MKRLRIINKIFGFLIGSILAAILLLALPIGCKSVRKSQNEKFETATVKKSDSSSSKSYSYVDTTKTDSSTEVTTTTVTIDSVEYNYVPHGDLVPNGNFVDLRYAKQIPIPAHVKAHGMKVSTTTIKQAAIKAKGVTIKDDVKQADIKTDSAIVKTEKVKEIVKKPSVWMGMGLVFGLVIVAGLIWVIIWVYRRKKKAIDLVTGKIF